MCLDIKRSPEECLKIGDAYIDQDPSSDTGGHLFVLKEINQATSEKIFEDIANLYFAIDVISRSDIDNLFDGE